MTNSAVYEGRVDHARVGPRPHAFRYRVAWFALDLDEVDALARRRGPFGVRAWSPLRFRRADFMGDPSKPLDAVVRDRVERDLDVRPAGRVVLMTQLRQLGYHFDPVDFYYCYDADRLVAVVAEITNTPWNERHAYVLDARGARDGVTPEWRFTKRFHVSPFHPMDQTYVWSATPPGDELVVAMRNVPARAGSAGDGTGDACFTARLALRRRPWTAAHLWRVTLRYLAQPLRMHLAIYWQAARLWWKRTPFHPHPRTLEAGSEVRAR